MQLTVQNPDLSQMFGPDNLYNTLYGMQRQDQANTNQQQNLGQAQQEQQFQAQDQPFNLQQLAANVGHTQALTGLTNAQTPGMQADSNMKMRADQVDSMIPVDKKRDAALSKIAATMTEDEAKAHEAKARTDLFSPDPTVRSNAMMVLDNMPDVRAKMREIAAEGANSAGVARIQGANQIALEKQQALDGRWTKNSMEYLKYQANAKANFQQQAGIAQREAEEYANSAAQAQDPDEKAFYQKKAQDAMKIKQEAILNDYRAKQAAAMGANAGKLNVAPLAGADNVVNVDTLPTPPVDPNAVPTPQSPTPSASPTGAGGLVRVQASDGSVHTVPRSALANLPKSMKVLDK